MKQNSSLAYILLGVLALALCVAGCGGTDEAVVETADDIAVVAADVKDETGDELQENAAVESDAPVAVEPAIEKEPTDPVVIVDTLLSSEKRSGRKACKLAKSVLDHKDPAVRAAAVHFDVSVSLLVVELLDALLVEFEQMGLKHLAYLEVHLFVERFPGFWVRGT